MQKQPNHNPKPVMLYNGLGESEPETKSRDTEITSSGSGVIEVFPLTQKELDEVYQTSIYFQVPNLLAPLVETRSRRLTKNSILLPPGVRLWDELGIEEVQIG